MLGSECNPCCSPPDHPCRFCAVCADDPRQIVLEFESGGGSGVVVPRTNGSEYSIECNSANATIVYDIVENCCLANLNTSTNALCPSVTTSDGSGLEIIPWGGPLGGPVYVPCVLGERHWFFFLADFAASRTRDNLDAEGHNTNLSEDTVFVFAQEGAFLYQNIAVQSSFFLFGIAWKSQLRVNAVRQRKKPVIELVASPGTGAVLTPTLSQKVDEFGRPYWRIDSVQVENGGSGFSYPVFIEQKVLNGSGVGPRMDVVLSGGSISEVFLADEYNNLNRRIYLNQFVGLSGMQVTKERSAPTVHATPPNTTSGMELAVSLSRQGTGVSSIWAVDAVSVVAEGSGWNDGDPVTFTADGGADLVIEEEASAVLDVSRVQPSLTATIVGGSGGTLSVTVASNGTTPETWGVDSVSVSGKTSGYADNTAVTISGGNNVVTQDNAVVYARTGREEPAVGVGIIGSGNGADFSITLSQTDDWAEWPARPAWTISSITITDGGTGYEVNDQLQATTQDQQSPSSSFYAVVDAVDEDGAITSVQLWDGGLFFKNTGEIESFSIVQAGAYYEKQLDGVSVTDGGKYYLQTYVDTTTPIEPPDCKGPGDWPLVGEKITGPAVGEAWQNGYMFRRCEFGSLQVTIQ